MFQIVASRGIGKTITIAQILNQYPDYGVVVGSPTNARILQKSYGVNPDQIYSVEDIIEAIRGEKEIKHQKIMIDEIFSVANKLMFEAGVNLRGVSYSPDELDNPFISMLTEEKHQ